MALFEVEALTTFREIIVVEADDEAQAEQFAKEYIQEMYGDEVSYTIEEAKVVGEDVNG